MQEQATAGFWLSPQQKFAWKLEQEVLRTPLRAGCLIALEGALRTDKLHNSLQEIVSRHEILRTVFRRQTGMKVPFQVVLESAEFGGEQVDLSGLVLSERESRVHELFDREIFLDAKAEDAPALRAVLIKLGPGCFSLVLSVRSLCADAQSLKLLAGELGAIYAGERDSLRESFRYVQFAQWQTDLLESDDDGARVGREFWAKCGTESFNSVNLPFEGDAGPLFVPKVLSVKLGSDLSETILRRAEPSATLFSAWAALMGRLSGQNAFAIGYETDSRAYEELEHAVGRFARVVPIPVRIESDFRFADVLRQTAESVNTAVAMQEYFSPEAVGMDGELVGFSYDDLGGEQRFGGVGFRLERQVVVSERFKLRLTVVQREAELELEFHYDASRLERAAVEPIAGYYRNLLAAALANPETLVAKLPLLSDRERWQLLVEWNQTSAAYPAEQCLHELFEQQATRTPEQLAVRCGERTLSYRELNERANQLAHYLRKQGVGPNRPVGLCLERSAEMMVAVLGILKAGGAYVPLNPDNPAARLQQQLAGAAALITESKLVGQMPAVVGPECPTHTLVLDRDQKLWADESTSNPERNTNPENLVYVIYTSGSTGVPKGVAVRHRNLVNYADFIRKRLELEKYPEGLQFATVSTLGADLGNTGIYPALISGGGLHIVDYEMATDPQRFAEYVGKHPIDVLKIVPSHLQALLQSEEAKKLLPRKYLVFGGETLTPKLLEKVAALNPECEILNHYGPTETTVGSLTLKLENYDWKKAKPGSIPIGKPIQNTQVYVLDQNLEPVPIGVTGELYIAGAGVTAGYLGQAEKTAERFLQNPFASDADAEFGKTMYRTGDLARYLEDGNIEFLGRGDDQVKIRGFRIELGEIEAVLARHAGVKQAVVLARAMDLEKDAQGDKRLLAYVVANRGSSGASGELSGEDLRNYLKQQLPDYMVPQAVMILAKLPLNANGKLDRQALPEPEQESKARVYVAPRTATEQAIAEIWAEVLRRDKAKLSVEDNFFDLGGHSLLATQVISRMRERFSVEVPMRLMFDQPRISGLAEGVEQARGNGTDGDEMAITAVSREAFRA